MTYFRREIIIKTPYLIFLDMILRLLLVCLFSVYLVYGELHGKIPQQANRPNEKAVRMTITDESAVEIYQVL